MHVDFNGIGTDFFAPFTKMVDQLLLAHHATGALQKNFQQGQFSPGQIKGLANFRQGAGVIQNVEKLAESSKALKVILMPLLTLQKLDEKGNLVQAREFDNQTHAVRQRKGRDEVLILYEADERISRREKDEQSTSIGPSRSSWANERPPALQRRGSRPAGSER